MELPIDHFRLLGVGPTTDSQSVLHTLQQRLDRLPSQGFTKETLQAREDLLRVSADLLSDLDRRLAYESDLTAISNGTGVSIPALDVPSSKEVGGLVLLLEAGQALESFELAHRALQPPQAPALGSSREADLSLLAGLAALAAAADLHQQRHYETAAQILKQGLQLLQRMGQHPALRRQIQQELDGLAPFRVLDLLSRNLTATSERAEGLTLLQELVERRGGLEQDRDTTLPRPEFDAFFQQIRAFLTVQEQVDLFSRWASGSKAADALVTKALTASGFAQRKPERIATAKERFLAGDLSDGKPLLACLQLLLGEVEQASITFEKEASPELKFWAAKQSSDPLAQLCAYCSDWLSSEVLPGYRDLEADPDLEAYFADRDVQAYVEQHDPLRNPNNSRLAVPAASGFAAGAFGAAPLAAASEFISNFGKPLAPPPLPPSEIGIEDSEVDPEEGDEPWLDDFVPRWRWPQWQLPELQLPEIKLPELGWLTRRQLGWGAAGLAAAVLTAAALTVATGLRNKPKPATLVAKPILAPAPKPLPAVPLTADEPSDAQLQALLDAWLSAKAAVLAGKTSTIPLNALARPRLIENLQADRRADQSRGETQSITAHIQSLQIDDRSPSRIAVNVSLDYSETVLRADGTPSGDAIQLQLQNRYVFARDEGTWRLASFQPASR